MVITKKNIRTGSPSAAVLGNPVLLNPTVDPMDTVTKPPPVPNTQAEWDACQRGDWLILWAEKSSVDARLLVLARCAMVRLVLENAEARSVEAVDKAEAWARGMATVEEVKLAVIGANAAFLAQVSDVSRIGDYSTAYYSAYAAATAADSVYLTEEPSFSVASAVSAARVAKATPRGMDTFERIMRAKTPRDKIQAECADLVRSIIAWDALTVAKD